MSQLSPTVLAKLAALRAGKAVENKSVEAAPESTQISKESQNESQNQSISLAPSDDRQLVGSSVSSETSVGSIPVLKLTDKENISDINHLDFLSKLTELHEAIHKQHPQMPILLRTIHKQLMEDPELTTLLNEEAIGVVVTGLQIQTKTQLITIATKESKSKTPKVKLEADMF